MPKPLQVLTLLKEVPFPSAYRLFERFPFSDTIFFSVQGSIDHECLPLDTIEPTKYTSMEVAFFKNNEFCEAKEVVTDVTLLADLEPYFLDHRCCYAEVPVKLIDRIHLWLTFHYDEKIS